MKWPKFHLAVVALFLTFATVCLPVAVAAPTVQEGASLAMEPPPSAYDLRDSSTAGLGLVGEDHIFMAQGLKSLLILSAVIALAYFSLRVLKRFMDRSGMTSNSLQLRTLARTCLDQKNFVHIVQVNKRYFLVGANEHAISLLAELSAADVDGIKDASPAKATFSTTLEAKDNG